jgi:type IV pilus assembly protein PilB
MASARRKLGELLVANRSITKEQLREALELQRESLLPLGQILVRAGMVSEGLLLQSLAALLGVPAWRLDRDRPSHEALDKLCPEVCRQYQVLPIEVRGDLLILGMKNPADIESIEMVRNLTGMRVEPVLVSDRRLEEALAELGGIRAFGERMDGLVAMALSSVDKDQVTRGAAQRSSLAEAETRPVVGLVNQILTDAVRMRASDVHIEPRFEKVEIRFRVDGELVTIRDFPKSLLPMVVARIKIMAELDIVEYRMPQDGRIGVAIDGRVIDLRVSVLPNIHGPRVVLRVLDKTASLRSLEQLGFDGPDLALIRALIAKPYGMMLVTGPTGSGKTTTLYAALGELRARTRNIMTCEDPVEYDIEGINQSQVNEKVGLTFAAQLRAILRQDPDVVLVGEIRDGETIQTALRAALTGHLVLSTLHCNDAVSAVPRLLDMGADPFLVSTTLIGVTAQRLVRALCPHCRRQTAPSPEESALLEPYLAGNERPIICEPAGCARCNRLGYRGRLVLQEVLPVGREVSKAIANRRSAAAIRAMASEMGCRTMADDAIARILAGQTTFAEARRQVFFEDLPRVKPGARAA